RHGPDLAEFLDVTAAHHPARLPLAGDGGQGLGGDADDGPAGHARALRARAGGGERTAIMIPHAARRATPAGREPLPRDEFRAARPTPAAAPRHSETGLDTVRRWAYLPARYPKQFVASEAL